MPPPKNGTGFAPLKSMLRHALENGSRRPIQLYWGARAQQDLYEEAQVLDEEWAFMAANTSTAAHSKMRIEVGR
jgi:CDP-4-dehydro-6-deoxyglucose reductase